MKVILVVACLMFSNLAMASSYKCTGSGSGKNATVVTVSGCFPGGFQQFPGSEACDFDTEDYVTITRTSWLTQNKNVPPTIESFKIPSIYVGIEMKKAGLILNMDNSDARFNIDTTRSPKAFKIMIGDINEHSSRLGLLNHDFNGSVTCDVNYN